MLSTGFILGLIYCLLQMLRFENSLNWDLYNYIRTLKGHLWDRIRRFVWNVIFCLTCISIQTEQFITSKLYLQCKTQLSVHDHGLFIQKTKQQQHLSIFIYFSKQKKLTNWNFLLDRGCLCLFESVWFKITIQGIDF